MPNIEDSSKVVPPRPSRVMNLVRILNGGETGVSGEQIRHKTQALNASRAADAGRKLPVATSRILRELSKKLSHSEATAPGLSSLESASAAQALAKEYRDIGYFELSLQFYHEALAARQFLLGGTHATTLNTLDSIAGVFEIQSKWDDARAYYQQSLDGRRDNPAFGPDHPSILVAATKVAKMLNSAGSLEDALGQYTDILTRYSAMPNKGSTPALAVRSEIATINLKLKNFQEAATQYRIVLEGRQSNLGAGHRLTIETVKAIDMVEKLIADSIAEPADGSSSTSNPEITSDSSTSKPSFSEPPCLDFDLSAYKAAIAEKQKSLGKQHPETLKAMFDLAQAYASNGQDEAAIGWYHETLMGRENIFGQSHPLVLSTCHALAESYKAHEDYSSALKYCQQALHGREVKLGLEHQDTLRSVLTIGGIYKALREYSKAIDLMTRAVDGYKSKFGPTHPSTLHAQYQLAETFKQKGRLNEALEIHQEVLCARLEVIGISHQATFASQYAIGSILHSLSRDAEAAQTFLELLNGEEKLLGKYHSSTTATALQLGSVYWTLEKWTEALTYYQFALEGIQRLSKCHTISGWTTISNIALCHVMLEQFNDALELQRKVLGISETVHGIEHPGTIQACDRLAQTCMKTENFEEAQELYGRVLVDKEKKLPDTDADVSRILFQLSLCCFSNAQYEKSAVWARRLLSAGNETHIEHRIDTMRRLGIIYTHQARNEEALEILQKALEESTAALGNEHWLSQRLTEQITSLYLTMDRDTTASQIFQKQLEWAQSQLSTGNPEPVILLCELARVHEKENQYSEALSLWSAALETITSSHALFSLKPDITCNIIDIHIKLHDTDIALSLLQDLLQFQTSETEQLNTYLRIGSIHDTLSDYSSAITAFTEVLRIEESSLGETHSDTLCTLRKLSSLYLSTGDLKTALGLCQRAVAGFRSTQSSIQVYATLTTLSQILIAMGHLTSALEAQEEAAIEFETVSGPLDEQSLRAGLLLAEMYQLLERNEKAVLWFEKVLSGYKQKLGARHPGAEKAERGLLELRGCS
jgi:tetratricopeptide (TPR) repeat protein